MYGETRVAMMSDTEEDGLSPRVRGNPIDGDTMENVMRSIPACTGKPWRRSDEEWRAEVYPRVYGETHLVHDR